MAACAPLALDAADETDYGSDLDSEGEQLVIQALTQLEAAPVASLLLESIDDNAPRAAPALLPRQSPAALRSSAAGESSRCQHPRNIAREQSATAERVSAAPGSSTDGAATDTRSPLQRFRTLPMKPLSVTDLVSPSWCELQYWYTLTKHGRKRQTPAMKQGSRVHKKLEEEVHTIVEVLVQSREDAWGLKIWNVIQGLRTLRSTGQTRELEVWGVIDGQVVNGIIDELSYTCPDEGLEELAGARLKKATTQPPNQTSISQFFKVQGATELESAQWMGDPHPQRKVWITDVKTRGSRTLPQGSSMKPTILQLMLYRKLLADLASSKVDAETIFKRYRLKSDDNFTDAFVAQIGGLAFDVREDSPDDREAVFSSQQHAVSELLAHNSLAKLWGLMIQEFSKAIPGPDAIGQVLRAEFRNQQSGNILGSKTFVHDEDKLDIYIAEEMSWWRGERTAKGVDIEEAFKCRICEFADTCEWRKDKVEEAMQKYRIKAGLRSKSVV